MTKEVKIYNREDLLKKLTQESFYIDEATLNTYLKELKIEAIFEDNNVEFFDSTSLERIIELIKNQRKVILDNSKAQSERQDEIRTKLLPADIDLTELAVNPNNSFKLDISEKTLNMVARAISKKIVRQVNNVFSGDNLKDGNLTLFIEENKRLTLKLKMLEDENELLKKRLEEEKSNYKPSIFGLFKYVGKKKG